MRLLDLFCCAGGASRGYELAGFTDIVGVDSEPQPNYPYEFIQADAVEVLRDEVVSGFDVIHASPPCQAHSVLQTITRGDYPDLVAVTRDLLRGLNVPYVIENVVGAPLENPIMLCGSSFGLGANGRQLRRHRLFESNMALMVMGCQHRGEPVGVYGTGGSGKYARGYKGTQDEYVEAMGIDWASRAEIAQAIPPAYTEWIGEQLMQHLTRASVAS